MRFLNMLGAAALAAAVGAAPASAKDYKIGYSVFWGTNPFLVTMVNGAKKAAEEWKAKGVNVDIVVTNGGDTDKAKQVSDLEDLYAQKVNGVLIFPGDSVMVTEPIKNVFNANNIPVVITDIGVRSGEYISLIITDNKKGGESAGEYMAKLLPKGGKVITLDHAPTNDNGQTRRKGFETKSAELGLQVLKEQPVQFLTLDAEPAGDGGPAGRRAGREGRVRLQPARPPGRLSGAAAGRQGRSGQARRLRPRSGVLPDGQGRQDRRARGPGPVQDGL